jgi:hexosaminidase
MKTAQQCAVFLFNFSQTNTTPMKYKILTLLLLFSLISLAQQNLNLIPKPENIIFGKGSFFITSKTTIQTDKNSFEANYLKELIKVQTGLDLKVDSKNKSKSIHLLLKEEYSKGLTDESYELNVSNNKIVITASSKQGLFYGIQTFLQLIPFERKSEIAIPWLKITDQPKFQWRGMHLDVCRHFFPKDFIKKYIDYLAMYKMNTFHWHLTDDQGWRIEIKKYPKLTEVGAWRNGSMIGHYTDQTFDDVRHGGFYTQEEIKEIVAYAKERHITIIPEIEMPGHALAALASYPEFSCTGGPFEVGKTWGVLEDVFCPKDETFTFLENVLTEVMALFPSEYIHIGGDESPKVRWKSLSALSKKNQR